jgi:hypothetical protein
MEKAIEKFFLEFIDPYLILRVFHRRSENVLTKIDIVSSKLFLSPFNCLSDILNEFEDVNIACGK